MGTWKSSIFGDDVACDVRDEYLTLIKDGINSQAATKKMLDNWRQIETDPDDGPVFWIALAATQWEYGRLEPIVKTRALEIIQNGQDFHRWKDQKLFKRRESALKALRKKLLSPQPKPRRPRIKKVPPPEAKKVFAPDNRAFATAWDVGNVANGGTPRAQVYISMESKGAWGGGSVFVANCRWDAIGLNWLDSDTLEIIFPLSTQVEYQRDHDFLCGRTIKVLYSINAVQV